MVALQSEQIGNVAHWKQMTLSLKLACYLPCLVIVKTISERTDQENCLF